MIRKHSSYPINVGRFGTVQIFAESEVVQKSAGGEAISRSAGATGSPEGSAAQQTFLLNTTDMQVKERYG